MLTDEEMYFVNSVREPFQRSLLEAVRAEYEGLGWPLIVLSLVETTGIAMESVLTSNPELRKQFLGHIDALRLYVKTIGERGH